LKEKKIQSDLEYKILKNIEVNPNLTQRQLAKELDISLGKVNYIIRALLDIGWVKIDNFRKSDNKIGYLYLLTPEGIEQKAIITQQFLQRKIEEYDYLKKEIEELKKK
jgi:EPS-associated MarR family transcriptional regulator